MTENKLCGECGAEIPIDSVFCEICGVRLTNGTSDVDSIREAGLALETELRASETPLQLEPIVIVPQQYSAKRTSGNLRRLILLAIICFAPLVGLSIYFFTPSMIVPYFGTNSFGVIETTNYPQTSTTSRYLTTLTTPCQYCLYVQVTRTIPSTVIQMMVTTSSYTRFSTSSGVNLLSPSSINRDVTTIALTAAIVVSTAAFLFSYRKWGRRQASTA